MRTVLTAAFAGTGCSLLFCKVMRISRPVTYHEAVLATAQAGLAAAQNQELKDLITKAAPSVQAHLDHAKKIQERLAKSP